MTLPVTANAHAQTHIHADVAARAKSAPAKAARDSLAANPELADKPFGELVSEFAKSRSMAGEAGKA
jgi:hypothetical protein